MIELHLVLKPPPHQTRILTSALQSLAKNARLVPGCLAVEVYQTVAGPRYLCYDEIWESEAELRRMLTSRHFSQLAALMELSSEPPAFEFRVISQTFGLGFAEQIVSGEMRYPTGEQTTAEADACLGVQQNEGVRRHHSQSIKETKQ